MIQIQQDYAVISLPVDLLNQQKREMEHQVKRENPRIIYVFFRQVKEVEA
jgi:hypothetical protein